MFENEGFKVVLEEREVWVEICCSNSWPECRCEVIARELGVNQYAVTASLLVIGSSVQLRPCEA